jgi:hypothetical protein
MFADVVSSRPAASDEIRELLEKIDAHRAEKGWSPDGFVGGVMRRLVLVGLPCSCNASQTSPAPHQRDGELDRFSS